MKKALAFVIIVVLGVAIGLAARLHFGRFDRVDAYVDLLSQVCLPFANHEDPNLAGFEVRQQQDETVSYVSAQDRLMVSLSDRGCEVTEAEPYFEADEQARLLEKATAWVAAHFPEMQDDPDGRLETVDLSRVWVAGTYGQPDRWGIFLMRLNPSGPGAWTSVLVMKRPI
ncbi:hypothetical protein HCZ30_01920 [Marivivens donghaensis]|uniref:Uncharacterized protein n=1 Tax=Marivivens donghaensis TaxID=1699413 RepID=A0ABX0VTJ6_9RHOB|nr:hypothetical protein [Marivivens donghaensis]NIY71186.1 hypothetical protein [Marivivens donghaensis]